MEYGRVGFICANLVILIFSHMGPPTDLLLLLINPSVTTLVGYKCVIEHMEV
jgi:hypothetical protein